MPFSFRLEAPLSCGFSAIGASRDGTILNAVTDKNLSEDLDN
jgi:hypothetical protein